MGTVQVYRPILQQLMRSRIDYWRSDLRRTYRQTEGSAGVKVVTSVWGVGMGGQGVEGGGHSPHSTRVPLTHLDVCLQWGLADRLFTCHK